MLSTFWLRNVLRTTSHASFHLSSGQVASAPAALASLLFYPPESQIIGNAQCFATFLPFRAPASSFVWLFSSLIFLLLLCSSLTLSTSAFPSVFWNMSKFPQCHFFHTEIIPGMAQKHGQAAVYLSFWKLISCDVRLQSFRKSCPSHFFASPRGARLLHSFLPWVSGALRAGC